MPKRGSGHAISQAMGAAGERHVSSDRANRLTGRIGEKMQAVRRSAGAASERRYSFGRCGASTPVRLAFLPRSFQSVDLHDRRKRGVHSGGAHCLRYGMTSNHVLGIKAVPPRGKWSNGAVSAGKPPGRIGAVCFTGNEGLFGIAFEITLQLCPGRNVFTRCSRISNPGTGG